jgi:uncharacterized protein (TIGR03067 family)
MRFRVSSVVCVSIALLGLLLGHCSKDSNPTSGNNPISVPTELEGTWTGSTNTGTVTIVFSNNTFSMTGTYVASGTFSINTGTNPRQIDLSIASYPSDPGYQGKTSLGSYVLNGNSLQMVMDEPGTGTRGGFSSASSQLFTFTKVTAATGQTELEGTWNMTSPSGNNTLVFSNNTFSITGDIVITGTFTINTGTNPKQIDMLVEQTSAGAEYQGKTTLGTYTLNGNTFQVTINQPGITTRDYINDSLSTRATFTRATSTPTQTELEGTWKMYSSDGNVTLVFANNTLTIYGDSGALLAVSTFTINTGTNPKQIDMTVTQSPTNPTYLGETSLGIYVLNGNSLQAALGVPGTGTRATFTDSTSQKGIFTKVTSIPTQTSLEGTWKQTAPGATITMTISGSVFSMTGDYIASGTVTSINTATSPAQIDIYISQNATQPQYQGKTTLGVFVLNGTALQLAFGEPGSGIRGSIGSAGSQNFSFVKQ